jgi:predicted transcriptional regulator
MAKSLTQMAADIVAAQSSHVSMSADEMDAALKKVFEALKEIKGIEETPAGEAVDDELARLRANPMKSIKRAHVINLEDGSKYKQLTAKTLAKFGQPKNIARNGVSQPGRPFRPSHFQQKEGK